MTSWCRTQEPESLMGVSLVSFRRCRAGVPAACLRTSGGTESKPQKACHVDDRHDGRCMFIPRIDWCSVRIAREAFK